MLSFYIVVTAEGKLKTAHVYTYLRRAENAASQDGDSVVEVEVPHSKAPIFIRSKKVEE